MHIDVKRFARILAITAIGGASLFATYMSATAESPTPAIVDVDVKALATTDMTAIEDMSVWKVVEGRGARASGISAFKSSDKQFDAGVSQFELVTLELRDWPIDEFMYIVEGKVEIIDASGHSRIYGPGDAFVMPKGFNGTWKQHSAIKKINVSYGSFE